MSDLDSGYWHVPIHPDSQSYLGLHFVHPDGSITYWTWIAMPLGIVETAYIFTKITKPLMAFMCRRGARVSNYIYISQVVVTRSRGKWRVLVQWNGGIVDPPHE